MAIAGAVDTIPASGVSGKQYSFKMYPWGTQFKALGAVYLILHEGNPRFDLLYVGQTDDLSTRFDNHHKQPCFDRNRRTHIAVLVEQSEAARLRIESDLIQKYKPGCNG